MVWVLLGAMKTFNCHTVLNDVEEMYQFWEADEINDHSHTLSAKESSYCERLYLNTTRRASIGSYEVKIPTKQDVETLRNRRQ